MGLLSSLLCCGADARDDSEDKYPKPTNTRTASQSRSTTSNSPTKTKVTKLNGTASSANGSSKKAAGSDSNPSTSNIAKLLSKKEMLEDENSINETDTITNTYEDSNGTTAVANSSHGISPNEPVHEQDESLADQAISSDDEFDVNGEFDLSKIQVGQAFNKETGCLLGKKDTKQFGNKKCLVLDLDETLVHSSFKYLRTADFVIPVEIDNQVHHVYVIKRPGVDEFLRRVGELYEVVVFTASVAKYGDPLLNKLDIHKAVHHRLFRDSCFNYQGNFIKNLSQLGRPLSDSIIIDNSPALYVFHPQHSVPISSWFSDTHDNELPDLLPFLEDLLKTDVNDVGLVLDLNL